MEEIRDMVEQGTDETLKIMEEYKKKLAEVVAKEREQHRKDAEQESADIIAKAYQESTVVVTKASQEAAQMIAEAKKKAGK